MTIDLHHVQALLLDMDGVLYRGATSLPGAAELGPLLDRLGIRYLCLTNNSTRTPEMVSADMAQRGIALSASHILTSGLAAAQMLRDRYPRATRVFAIGMEGLQQALFADGYFTAAEHDVAVVVVGSHFGLVYHHLKVATLALRAGAAFVATNPDTTFPLPEGLVPGAGAIIAALVAASDRQPEIVGKPEPALFRAALERLDLPAAATLMVGDRLDTDIAGAQRAGIPAVLVTSGINSAAEGAAWSPPPALILPNLAAVLALLERQAGRR